MARMKIERRKTVSDKGEMTVEAIKFQHMFKRLDNMAMCIKGKLSYSGGSYYNGDPDRPACLRYHYEEEYAKYKVTKERIRQIKTGEAVLAPNIIKIIEKKPASTIASLYSFKKKLITAVRKAAKEEWQAAHKEWMEVVEQKRNKSNVMTGYVDDMVNRIKDAVSVGTLPLANLPDILSQFEETRGGTEGFIDGF